MTLRVEIDVRLAGFAICHREKYFHLPISFFFLFFFFLFFFFLFFSLFFFLFFLALISYPLS